MHRAPNTGSNGRMVRLMGRQSSGILLGLLLVVFGFLWLASDQGWIQLSKGLVLAVGAMLLGIWLIIRALVRH